MSREEIQKLLGGYATDTLSEAERRALFEAALEDQDLFDALAKEQALRDVLQDSATRQKLIEALGPAREPYSARVWHWLRQPVRLAMAGGIAALLIVGGLVLRQTKHAVARREVMVADAITQGEASTTAPQSATAPSAPRRKLFRPPAGHIAKPSLQLPEPPAIAAPREVVAANLPAAPAAPPPRPSPKPLPASGLAGFTEGKSQALQARKSPILGFNGSTRLPAGAMTRAKAASVATPKAAVQYTLLLKDTGGAYSPVASGTVFHPGDSVRLQIEPSEAGYIYLFQHDENSGWRLVESQLVEKAQRYMLPTTGGVQSDKPATLELLLVLSRQEHVDVDAKASQAQASLKIMIEYR